MREVTAVFQEGLMTGLSVSAALNTQAQYLIQCYNVVPGPYGLESRQEVSLPLSHLQNYPWPWPICFCLSRHTLIFTPNQVFLADAEWDLQLLAEYEWGSLPHIADFMDTVIWSAKNGQWMFTLGKVTTRLGAQFKTCCNFRGQLIVGNGSLPRGPERLPDGTVEQSRVPVEGSAIVGWTKIGALDWEYTLGNEVGWAPMPWDGEVLALLPLGKEVVVYGTNGCAKLAMAASPVTTFGVQDFGDIGVLNADCVAGDTTSHLYLGQDSALYLVEPERALSGEGKLPKRLGYDNWLRVLENPVMSFDSAQRHWWIGDENRCFIFTGKGLAEANITPTHLSRLDGPLWGFYREHGPDVATIETGPTSFDSRGIKTLMCVEADIESDTPVFGWATWKVGYSKQFQIGRPIRLDPRGAFFPVLSGTELTVGLQARDYHSFRLSKMWLRYKNTDKTFARGVINAGRPAEQGNF